MFDERDFFLCNYRYALPEAGIARYPPDVPGDSRLMVARRPARPGGPLALTHTRFAELGRYLPPASLLVVNNSKVLPARLRGVRASGGKVEFLLLTPLPLLRIAAADAGHFCAEAEGLLRAGGRVAVGECIRFGAGLELVVLGAGEFGRKRVRLSWRGEVREAFRAVGHMPLPPYIRREAEALDTVRYQTIFAREEKTGSVAAPTAGLHFTPALREALDALGCTWAEVTLHVGYGTFSPVRHADIREHHMHPEYMEVTAEAAAAVRQAREDGRAVIAVGTTALRALEGCARATGGMDAHSGWTDIFLYPSQSLRVVDGLITNFHQPESSLLMLLAALTGRQALLDAYAAAVARGYRFLSYGDAMLVL